MKNKTKFVVQTTATPEWDDTWEPEFSSVSEKKARHYGNHHRKEKWWRMIEVEI